MGGKDEIHRMNRWKGLQIFSVHAESGEPSSESHLNTTYSAHTQFIEIRSVLQKVQVNTGEIQACDSINCKQDAYSISHPFESPMLQEREMPQSILEKNGAFLSVVSSHGDY